MLDLVLTLAPVLMVSLGVPLQSAPAAAPAPQEAPASTPADDTLEAAGQPATQGSQAETPAPVDAKTAAEPKTAKSVFKNLRFDEDWSALGEPGATTDHWMPGLKHIALDGDDGQPADWTASFGGQVRLQAKSEDNRNLLGTVPGNNDFNLLRLRMHGDLRYRDDVRVFIEMIAAGIHGNDAAPLPIDEQDFDLLNGFLEFPGEGVLTRLGRFELQYGAQRLISPLEWANTRRTFQGGLFRGTSGSMTTDVFFTRPIEVDPHENDTADHDRWFSGVYNTWKLGEGTGADLYALALNDDNDAPFSTPAGGPPTFDGDVYTLGGRYFAQRGGLDYELEAAQQLGNRNGLDVDAYMWTVVTGYTLPDCPMQTRVAVDFDYASGDGNVADNQYETFNQLYPLAHAYFGFIDLIGRQNIFSIMPNATIKLCPAATFRISYSDFALATDSDFLYGSAGAPAPGQGATPLDNGKDVGREVDLTLAWKPAFMAPHGEFLFGYSYFNPGDMVESYGDGEDANLLYAQYIFTF
jgi:hypothetical protein